MPRNYSPPANPAKAGREKAQRLYPAPLGPCEACGVKPARERHHKDGDPQHNERSNVAFLCARCHMVVDGRLEAFLAQAIERAPNLARIRWASANRPRRSRRP